VKRRATRKSAHRFALAATAALSFAGGARAAPPDDTAIARAAYNRGKAAYDAHKYGEAAREFTRADELSPNPVVLELALEAALQIDDPVLGMGLVERAVEESVESKPIVREARAKFAQRVGRITLVCTEGPCHARIDGVPAKPVSWVTPGAHAIEWDPSGRTTVTVAAGQSVEARPAAPLPTENSDKDEKLSPTWFWVGIGLTTIVGGASLASGVDTLHQHQVFAANPSAAGQQDGRAAQLRTNVLFGVTAALAVATAGVGIFAVRWDRGQKTSASVDLAARGLGFAVTLHR
jgi:hypothetical protein